MGGQVVGESMSVRVSLLASIVAPLVAQLDLELYRPERRLVRACWDLRDLRQVQYPSGMVASWLCSLGHTLHCDTAGRYPWLDERPDMASVVGPLTLWLLAEGGQVGQRKWVELTAHTWHQEQPTLELVPLPPYVLQHWAEMTQFLRPTTRDPVSETPEVRAWVVECQAQIAAAMDTQMDRMVLQALGVGPTPADASTRADAPTSGAGMTLERFREARAVLDALPFPVPAPDASRMRAFDIAHRIEQMQTLRGRDNATRAVVAAMSEPWGLAGRRSSAAPLQALRDAEQALADGRYGAIPDEPEPLDHAREESRGLYLCETCFDCMTSRVIAADVSGTGLEMAQCVACAGEQEAVDG